MSKENRSLSPLPYLKNNKRRSVALILSIALFGTMLYVLGYFLGTFGEPYGKPADNIYKHVTLAYEDLDSYLEAVDDYYDQEKSFDERILPPLERETDVFSKELGEEVLVVRKGVFRVESTVGMVSLPLFYFQDQEDLMKYYEKFGMELTEGRLPEKPGELLVDEISSVNQGDELLNAVSDEYKVVGKVKCDCYALIGLPLPNENNYMCMILHDENTTDYRRLLEENGHELSYYFDYNLRIKSNENNNGSMDKIKSLFTVVSASVLLVCVTVVLSLHIRDRHEEWCLLNSIGFSVTDVYLMAIKELLICFGLAILLAGGFSAISVFLIKTLMVDPKGFAVRYIRPEDMKLIGEVFLAVFAFCNLPIFIQLRKITTVDDIEE